MFIKIVNNIDQTPISAYDVSCVCTRKRVHKGGYMVTSGSARGKIVRRFGENIFGNPKFDRLLQRKPHGPGKDPSMRGGRRAKQLTDFDRRLREKQRLRMTYGLKERQFQRFFERARALPGQTGDELLSLLERRLDNIIYRLGIAATRPQARQMVVHGHVWVNGRRVDRPSSLVDSGDRITLSDHAPVATHSLFTRKRPSWLVWDESSRSGIVNSRPLVSEIIEASTVDTRLVIEYYAR